MKNDPYDTLTLELYKAETLVCFLTERLSDVHEGTNNRAGRELYALELIAGQIQERLAVVKTTAAEALTKTRAGVD